MNLLNSITQKIISKVNNSLIFAEYYNRSDKGKRANYTRQATMLSRKRIEDYISAVTAATDPTNPRLGDWMRFRLSMKNDAHLMSCIENRTLPVQCAPFKLIDSNGEEDEEAKKLLEKPWMLELVDKVLSHVFDGVKLLGMFEVDENGELKKIEEIPQSNFIPQKGIIIQEEYDTEGVSYRDGAYKNYYFQVGDDWSIGILSGLANIVLAKKLGLGSWMSFIEKYGVPPIFAITERMDSTRRDELFEMLEEFRMNHFAVLQGKETIEIPQGYNVDAHNTFKSLMSDICDKEMSKRILGSSGIVDEKSYVGAAEVQERLLQYRHKVDKLLFKYYFNTEVKPRLVKLSSAYAPLANLTFEYDESETLSMNEIIDAVKGLATSFEFDIDELKKLTGLPITKIKGLVPANKEEEEKKKEEAQKKKDNPEGFSPLSPRAWSTPVFKSSNLVFAGTWNDAIDKLIEDTRKNGYDGTVDREFLLKTYDRLNKAAANGYGKNYYTDNIARHIRQNLLEFAATKTHIQQKELQVYSDSISDGKLYKQESKKYLGLQNGTYLDVQASFSARKAQSARQWQDFERDIDVYPRLKVRTMNDKDVRPSHAALEGYVFSIKDPDADRYTPPYDPRCRCWLEQTRDMVSEFSPEYQPDPQWSGNAGKTGIVFNDENSYNAKIESNSTRLQLRGQAELAKEFMPYNKTISAGNKTIFVNDFADASDLDQNIEAAKKMAEALEKDIYIRHHINIDGHKNPELGIGNRDRTADLKTYDGTSKIENFVRNRIRSVSKQNAEVAVLDLSKFKGSEPEIMRHIKGSLISGNKGIKEVYVIQGDIIKKYNRSIINENPNKYRPVKTLEDAVRRAEFFGFKKTELGKASLEQVNIVLEALHKEIISGGKTTIGELRLSDDINKKGKGIVAGRYWHDSIKQGKMLEINLKAFTIDHYSEVRSFDDRIKNLDKRMEQSQDTIKKMESQLGKNKAIDKILKQDIKREKQMISDFEYKKAIYEKKVRNNESALPENVANLFKDKKEQIISIIHHEYGHYIDDIMQKDYSTNTKGVSVYGASDRKEFFAEWYSLYQMTGTREMPDDLFKIFKEWEQRSKD